MCRAWAMYMSLVMSVDDNRHLGQQFVQRIMNTLCSLNESGIVRLIGDHIDIGEHRAQFAL